MVKEPAQTVISPPVVGVGWIALRPNEDLGKALKPYGSCLQAL
jgi:hypothetical protein